MDFKTNFKAIGDIGDKVTSIMIKHGPMGMVIFGCAGFVATTVVAIENSRKADHILDEAKEAIEKANKEEDAKAVREAKVSAAGKVTKAYIPSILIGGASIALVLGGTSIIHKRYSTALLAASLIDTQYTAYRNNVIDELGEEADFRFRTGAKKETIKEKETGKDGKKKTVNKDVNVIDDDISEASYAVIFNDKNAPNVFDRNDRVMNLDKIRFAESYANDILHARGHIFLNEVYDELGVRHTTAGQLVGWLDKNKYGELATGDDYVTFTVMEIYHAGDPVPEMVINFNVDGLIFDKINKSSEYKAPTYLKFPRK